mmetsp:Transcript_22845/g.52295  ORF Transcript_22845/g.52295 Transcript_22845/m.52295 type:complete len:95 (+) Transcript_22845:49-333(+)
MSGPRRGQPSWNGNDGEYCTRSWRATGNLCISGCGQPTWNGNTGHISLAGSSSGTGEPPLESMGEIVVFNVDAIRPSFLVVFDTTREKAFKGGA